MNLKLDEMKECKKEGFMVYTKCPICDDLSYCEKGGAYFCINQHKDDDGDVTQPASLGVHMVGKRWEQTPKGKKWAEKRRKKKS